MWCGSHSGRGAVVGKAVVRIAVREANTEEVCQSPGLRGCEGPGLQGCEGPGLRGGGAVSARGAGRRPAGTGGTTCTAATQSQSWPGRHTLISPLMWQTDDRPTLRSAGLPRPCTL